MSDRPPVSATRAPRTVQLRCAAAAAPAPARAREPAVWLAAPGAFFFLILVGIPLVIVAWTSLLHIDISNIAHWATAPFAG